MTDAEAVHMYTITIELLKVETNEKVWIGNEQVKKIVTILPPCPADKAR